MKLYVGMKFKPLAEPDIYGECISLSEKRFSWRWFTSDGTPFGHISDMPINEALRSFEYYGWVELSELEEELL